MLGAESGASCYANSFGVIEVAQEKNVALKPLQRHKTRFDFDALVKPTCDTISKCAMGL